MWSHTYNENEIPGPNPSGTITEHSPGKKIAKAITELQEKVIAGIESVTLTDLDGSIEIVDNKLVINLSALPPINGVPDGGNFGDVLIKLATGVYGWEPKYPENRSVGDVLTVGPTNVPVWSAPDAGLPTPENAGDILTASQDLEPEWQTQQPTERFTGIIDQVVDVSFENNSIVEYKRSFRYVNGILESVGDEYLQSVIEFQPFECG